MSRPEDGVPQRSQPRPIHTYSHPLPRPHTPRRLPTEAESAALGAALQAAAVLAGVPVADYVAANPPPVEPEAGVEASIWEHWGWGCAGAAHTH
jgi:hypothetical protein